jgi:hypothetical protein
LLQTVNISALRVSLHAFTAVIDVKMVFLWVFF